jgi:hypothetical protein
LPGGVEEGRSWPEVVVDDDASRVPGWPGKAGRQRPSEIEQAHGTPTGFGQPVVELIHQEVLQRKLGTHADGRAHQRQQNDLRGEKPGP